MRQISEDEFVERFDKPKLPVVLTHVQDHWLARKKWTVEVRNNAPHRFECEDCEENLTTIKHSGTCI